MTEITVTDFIEQITNENYEIKQVEAKEADFAATGSKLVGQMLENFLQLTEADRLAQSRLLLQTTTEEAVIVSLESGIVNLPFENIKQVDNFFEEPENPTELTVNLIVKNSAVNASGLRIDQICTLAELKQSQADYTNQITERVQELLKKIKDNLADKEGK